MQRQQLRTKLLRLYARALFSLLALSSLASCISIPRIESFDVGTMGTAVETNRFLGLTVLRSASFISGEALQATPKFRTSVCGNETLTISVSILAQLDTSTANQNQICEEALQAVQLVDRMVSAARSLPRHYEIYIFPFGIRYSKSNISWTPGGRLKPIFLAYAYTADSRKTRVGIVDTVAHETLHMWSAILGAKNTLEEEEQIAYNVGACAQLKVEGSIKSSDLTLIARNEGTREMQISEKAAARVVNDLKARFSNGALDANSVQGRDFLAKCYERANSYFATAPRQ
jgi:hypothetical protein